MQRKNVDFLREAFWRGDDERGRRKERVWGIDSWTWLFLGLHHWWNAQCWNHPCRYHSSWCLKSQHAGVSLWLCVLGFIISSVSFWVFVFLLVFSFPWLNSVIFWSDSPALKFCFTSNSGFYRSIIWCLGRICAVPLCLCNYLNQYEKVGSSHLWKWVFIHHMCWFGLKRGSISVPVFLACNGFCDFSNQNAFNYVNN